MNNPFSKASLPNSFHLVSKTDVKPSEIITLRESVGWSGDSERRWQECIDQSLAVIGVRDRDSRLVGMACITGNIRHAVLCDLAVHPDHQRLGIGAAIMSELLKTTDSLGIMYVYAELANTNPFRDKMMAAGFETTGNSLFRSAL